jgi:NDP-sugar pyrophosphorylase family protein
MSAKLMILAAGMSSRMKQSSAENLKTSQINQANTRPKCMIEVGENKIPFLLYLLSNAGKAGCGEVCLILNEKDQFTKAYLHQNPPIGLSISFVYQEIPVGREKPLGTADAVLQGINGCPEWRESSFIVCNSDNLYSVRAFMLLLKSTSLNAMINYDFSALGVEENRIFAFSVIQKNDEESLIRIIEKPTADEVQSEIEDDGRIGVSMNLFKLNTMDVKTFLQNCPLHPTRNEKELPTAIQLMVSEGGVSLETIPLSEMVLDLTSKSDILQIESLLD